MPSQYQANSYTTSDPFSNPAMHTTSSKMYQQQNLQLQLYHASQQNNPANLSAVDPALMQRHLARSPISFREGRRASDGVMAQGPFQQRLYDKIKPQGGVELHEVHEECRALQNRFGPISNSAGNSRSGTPGEIFLALIILFHRK